VTASLRTAALQGGAFVAARQAVSLAVGLGGTVILTSLLGPAGYGRFAAALAFYTYAFTVAPLGVNAWLVRRAAAAGAEAQETEPAVAASARTLLLLASLGIGAIAALLIPLAAVWLREPALAPLAFAMLAGLPLQLLNLVPLAALERALNYRAVAGAELQGLFLYYGSAVLLAMNGWGPEAIVLGWWLQIVWIAIRVHRAAGLHFQFAWNTSLMRDALHYGLRYASSLWTYQLRDLVNPLVVGRWVGVEGVAVVALAVRLVEAASFVKVAVWRLSLPALARLQHDSARVAVAVRDGMRLQLMLVGPALIALAVVGVPVAVWLFGPEWRDLASVMALIAAGTLCNATFNLHSSALYALGRPAEVWVFHVVFVLLFVGGAMLCVPRFGVTGYGYAELIAFPSYVLVWRAYRRAVGAEAPQRDELILAAGLVAAVALSFWTPWAALIALMPLLRSATRALLAQSVMTLRGVFAGKLG